MGRKIFVKIFKYTWSPRGYIKNILNVLTHRGVIIILKNYSIFLKYSDAQLYFVVLGCQSFRLLAWSHATVSRSLPSFGSQLSGQQRRFSPLPSPPVTVCHLGSTSLFCILIGCCGYLISSMGYLHFHWSLSRCTFSWC